LRAIGFPCHQMRVIRCAPLQAFGVAVSIAGPLLVAPLARGAEPSLHGSLRYEADLGCPDEAAFRRQVRSRTERLTWVSGEADRRFTATVLSRGEEFFGRLDIQTREGIRSSREVSGTTCDEVVAALALIAALAVDPKALTQSPAEPALAVGDQELTPPPGPERPNLDVPAQPPAPVSTELHVSDTSSDAMPEVARAATAADDRQGWRTQLGAGAGVATGVFPTVAWLASVFVQTSLEQRRGWSPSIRLTVSGSARQSYPADHGQTQYQWLFGTLDACPLLVRLGSSVHVRACAFAEVGVLLADAREFDHTQAHTSEWGALGLLGRIAWSAGPWRFEGALGPRFALTRPSYFVELPALTKVHQVAVIGMAATTSIGFLFP
jgi:hypothetical protein